MRPWRRPGPTGALAQKTARGPNDSMALSVREGSRKALFVRSRAKHGDDFGK
jgi:hypothetical protein